MGGPRPAGGHPTASQSGFDQGHLGRYRSRPSGAYSYTQPRGSPSRLL